MKVSKARSMPSKRKWYSGGDWQLYVMMLPTFVLLLIFHYVPMLGLNVAFRDYRIGDSLFSLKDAAWVGLDNFLTYINSRFFMRTVWNTIRLNMFHIIFDFSAPIVFALILNEVRAARLKKTVQTFSYLPHFISTVVVAGMLLSFLEVDGIVNNFLGLFGIAPKEYITYADYYIGIYTATDVWKSFGFGSILYFSTISGIDQTLYEAARMDGANRWQQMRHVTVPSIAYIIAIKLVQQLGRILSSNTSFALLIYQPSTYSVSDTIGTYVYRMGIQKGSYGYSTAVSLFLAVIAFMLTYAANKASNKLSGYGMW